MTQPSPQSSSRHTPRARPESPLQGLPHRRRGPRPRGRYSRFPIPDSRSGGFTLLELVMAMTFVGLLAGGIVITISTALRVWNRAMRTADLQQEARAVTGLLSRDIRGAYLGLPPETTGYFLGSVAETQGTSEAAAPIDTLELTTDSSSLSEVALLPDDVRQDWDQRVQPPVTDLVGVRWEWRPADGQQPEGLYRVTTVVPSPQPEIDLTTGGPLGQVTDELISTQVDELRFRYYDGEVWHDSWDWVEAGNSVPLAVSIHLTMREEQPGAQRRPQDYTFETVVPIATR